MRVALGPNVRPISPALALFLSAEKAGEGRKRNNEGEREVGGEGGAEGGGRLHGQMDCSFSTHVEPCFVFHCRQAGAQPVALLARHAHLSSFSLAHVRTRARARTRIRKHSFCAHMLKSSPLLSASKTQHPRLLCCCQVLPLADATGESYPSEVGVPGERQAPRLRAAATHANPNM